MERISREMVGSEHPHRARYHFAAGLLRRGDAVLDAACGIGYGSAILTARSGVRYTGFDKSNVVADDYLGNGRFWQVDLDDFPLIEVPFDVTVTLETIEHLQDPERFVAAITANTRRTIVASVPTVPSVHFNEFHLHDFERDDLPRMFGEHGWVCLDVFDQPSESAAVYWFEPS